MSKIETVRRIVLSCAAAVLVAACGGGGGGGGSGGPANGGGEGGNATAASYFPLTPGARWVYASSASRKGAGQDQGTHHVGDLDRPVT